MLKQLLIISCLLGVATCNSPSAFYALHPRSFDAEQNYPVESVVDSSQESIDNEPVNQLPSGELRSSFGEHLKDVGRITREGTKNIYKDVKPVLNSLKGDVKHQFNSLKNNPKVQKGANKVNMHLNMVKNRAEPVLSKGGQTLTGLMAKIKNKNGKNPHQQAQFEQPAQEGFMADYDESQIEPPSYESYMKLDASRQM